MNDFRQYPIRSPLRAFWDVTYHCNYNCLHCYARAGIAGREELATKDAYHVIDELKDARIFSLTIAGGEPFLRHDLFDILSYAKICGIAISLATNGYFINEEVVKQLHNFKINSVQISLDGATQFTHENLRQKEGSFEAGLRAIRLLVNSGFFTSVGIVLTRLNYLEIPKIIDLSIAMGVRLVSIFRLMESGRGKDNARLLSLCPHMYRELIYMLSEKCRLWRGKVGFFTHDPLLGMILDPEKFSSMFNMDIFHHGCQAGRTLCYIDPYGNVYPCAFMPKFLGNIKEQSLKEIWGSPKLQCIRTMVEEVPEACRKCQYSRFCQSGCRGISYTHYGDLSHPDPLCLVYKEGWKYVLKGGDGSESKEPQFQIRISEAN